MLTPSPKPRRFSTWLILPHFVGTVLLALVGGAGPVPRVAGDETAIALKAADRIHRKARELKGTEDMCRGHLTAAIRAARVADEPGDDADPEVVRPPAIPTGLEATAVDELLGAPDPQSLAGREQRLDSSLHQKLGTIVWVCGLTESQRRKIELAGRGDIKRFLDRVDDQRSQSAKGDISRVDRISREVAVLRVLLNSGLHEEGSLFDKTLMKTLTAEQTTRFLVFRKIEALGGTIQKRLQQTEIRLSAIEIADSDLAGLEDLTGLQVLALDGTRVTDAGLVHLMNLKNLKSLDLARTSTGSTGLSNLHELMLLDNLDLTNTRVTDVGLNHLGKLSNLQRLYLCGTQITDAGLVSLKPLKNLEVLYMGRTRITHAGLVELELKNMTCLKELDLNGTQISDAALMQLEGLVKLRKLDLSFTRCTDNGLSYLKGLTGMQFLSLRSTLVTDAGVAELKRSLPRLTIVK